MWTEDISFLEIERLQVQYMLRDVLFPFMSSAVEGRNAWSELAETD